MCITLCVMVFIVTFSYLHIWCFGHFHTFSYSNSPFTFSLTFLTAFRYSFLNSSFHIWKKMYYFSFCIWLIFINVMTSNFSYFMWNMILFCIAQKYFIMYMTIQYFLICWPVDRHLDWFHSCAFINSYATNISMQISVMDTDFISFGYVSEPGLAQHMGFFWGNFILISTTLIFIAKLMYK